MYRTYILTSTLLAAFFAACIVVFCFIVDPFSIYPAIRGFSPEKTTDLFYHLRLHKPYAIENIQAEHLIVGSSRSASLLPEFLAAPGEPAYNAALPGVSMREVRRVVEHAHNIQPLKTLQLGIEYYMFRQGYAAPDERHVISRLSSPVASIGERISYRFYRFKDSWRSLFSVDAIIGSFQALNGMGTSQRSYEEDGTWHANPSTKSPSWFYAWVTRKKYTDYTTMTDRLDMEEFRLLLDFCRDYDIKVSILISPFHAAVLNVINLAGKWEDYLSWQRDVVKISAEYGSSIQIFGLETSTEVVFEAIGSTDPFFRDGIHYTSTGGRMVTECLAGPSCDNKLEFTRLDESTIQAYLEKVDGTMKSYKLANPADYTRVLKWLKLDGKAEN
jgi:hypothetical protein